MFCEQVSFMDETSENPVILGGILVDNKYVICGECGSVFEVEDVRIVRKFFKWVNISDDIMTE